MITPLDPRHLLRQTIVQQLFEWQQLSKIKDLHFKIRRHADDKTKQIVTSIDQFDQTINSAVVKWSKDKINNIDLAILRLAVFEIEIEKKEPVKVIIDEAIELAKEFGSDSCADFVNGILAKIISNAKR